MRKLISGREVNSGKPAMDMTISSECPDKWLFVDLETGDVWHVRGREDMIGRFPHWRGATKEEIKELKK